MQRFIYVVFLSLYISCSTEKQPPYKIPNNTVTLLTNDSTKTWKLARRYNGKVRMNMEGCFMSYRQTFTKGEVQQELGNGTVTDNNGSQANCGASLTADWQITTTEKGNYYLKFSSDQIPELLHQDENFKYFKILKVTKDSLVLSFKHTQFNKERIITDYLVQEDVAVPDRNFHH